MNHPGQYMIDFTIPACESLSIPQIARAMNLSTTKVYAAIDAGRLHAIDVGSEDAGREELRVPRNNYYCWLNNEYPDSLLYRFPRKEWLSVGRVANFFGISDETVHKHIRNGEFPNAEDIGSGKYRHWRIPLMDLIEFTYRRRAGACC